MKILLILLIIVGHLFSTTINESLLKVHATLIPKISLMDYKFQEKIQNNTIVIAIMYKDSEYKNAKSLKNKIDSRYKDGIKSYKIEANLVSYRDVKKATANIYYIFPTQESDIKKTIDQANINGALTFSYLKDDLKHGVMISLNVSKKIKPILNLDAIKIHKIAFRPVLIDISTIYNNHSSALDSSLIKSFNKLQFLYVV